MACSTPSSDTAALSATATGRAGPPVPISAAPAMATVRVAVSEPVPALVTVTGLPAVAM